MTRTPKARLGLTATFASLAVLGGVLAAAPAAAAPVTVPVLVAPTDGATISDSDLVIEATSSATHVKFVVDGRGGAFTVTDAVDTGQATATVSLFGLDGSTSVAAFDCDGADCNSVGDELSVDVDLSAPTLTAPSNGAVVANSFVASADASGGAVAFRVDSDVLAVDSSEPYSATLSIGSKNEGNHTLRALQCSEDGTVCEGPLSDPRTIVKDTKGPRWTDLRSSPGTVFPVRDNYKDVTKLSARVDEDAREVRVEIRKAGGPLVRTIGKGRVDRGRVIVSWNGRKANGDAVQPGKYLFRFIGSDKDGRVSKSGDRVIRVSGKRLVRQSASTTVSARGSLRGNGSGSCSDLFSLDYRQARFDWPRGVGYYSQVYCNGSREADLALGGHSVGVRGAIRYGTLSIQAYGAGAFRHAGPAAMLSVKGNGNIGKGVRLSSRLGWDGVKRLNMNDYVRGHRIRWLVGTIQGNWYDVKEFRVSYSYFVLR